MAPLLTTKLHIPAAHPDRILRSQLIQKLNQDLWYTPNTLFLRRLTLIAAPAGYGKSTLLYEWTQQLGLPIAWVTFDESDNTLGHFFQYLVAAIQTIFPGLRPLDLAALQSSSPSADLISSLVTSLLNDLTDIQCPFLLVFDDYHTLQSRTIHQAVALLLDRLPQNLSLVIATRADPPLPLSRLRARRQMAEVRASDLRFSESEAGSFFQKVMNLALQDNEVLTLTEITEGWVAGLQMAALALQGRSDSANFIRTFSGRERFVIDYLFEEVLSRQTETIQDFLIQTSILERLTGPLCDAVLGIPPTDSEPPLAEHSSQTSQSILEYLESANLFLVPLDNERQYYRYHRLFSDLLRHRLQRSFPSLIPQLHARAALWFEAQGSIPEAFDHWIAAGNHQKSVELIEKYGYPYFEQADTQQLAYWFQQLPPELIHARPWLCVFHSWGLIFTGRYAEADLYLSSAEKKLGHITEASDPISREQYGHIAASRAFLASRSQDAEGIFRYTDLALKYVPPERRAVHSFIAFFLGTGRYKKNQYTLAQEAWREAARLGKEAGNVIIAVNGLVTLAELNRIQGKLHESLGVCQEAARLALDKWGKPLPVSAEMYVGRARLYYEWNDFKSAEADFEEAAKLMRFYPGFDVKVEYNAWLSGLRLAQGSPGLAADLIHEIETSDRQPFYKSAAVFLAFRIHYYLTVGNLAMVSQILSQQDWNLEDKNIFAWAEAFLAYARVLIFQKEFQAAYDLLETCRLKLENYQLWNPALKALILQACITQQRGESAAAQKQILRALSLAEPEGFVRIFVDGGEEVQSLLSSVYSVMLRRDNTGENERLITYTAELLAAFPCAAAVTENAIEPVRISKPSAAPLEALTEREMEVLKLIANGLTNKEIAEQLVVTVGTVKTHTSNIYRKLDVLGRTKALAKAREFNLL
jgi:LuxR family maltose regulon positive regulatory protein